MDIQMLEKLIDVSRSLAEQRELDPLLEHGMTMALHLLNGEYGYLILLTSNGDLDFRVRQDWKGNRLADPKMEVSRTIFDQVISKRQSLLTADAIVDPNLRQSDSVMELGLRSVVCVPLITHEQVLGALYMENRSDWEIFGEDDLKVLEYFTAHLAVSIENAQLNDQLERRVEERTNDLKHALEDVARYSGELMRANAELASEVNTRRQVEEQLRKLSRVVEQSSNGVVIMDSSQRIEYVNPSFTTLTGYTAEEVVGHTADEAGDALGLTEVEPDAWKTLVAGEIQQLEVNYKKKTGETYWERLLLTSIRNADGAITHYAIIKEDITLKKLSEVELAALAITDPLTGAFNRRHFFMEGERAFQRSLRYHEPLTVLMMDADHFKHVNDTYGHQIGDQVLKGLVRLLSGTIRATDTMGRYGGEEFVIMMPGIGLSAAEVMANRLCRQMELQSIKTDQGEVKITVSIGVASFDSTTDHSFEQIMEKADQALYMAKQNGRNRAEAWTVDR